MSVYNAFKDDAGTHAQLKQQILQKMPSKLLFVVTAHTKFEVRSFSRSRDIGVCILKIWASSAILNSTLSGFWQFRSFPV